MVLQAYLEHSFRYVHPQELGLVEACARRNARAWRYGSSLVRRRLTMRNHAESWKFEAVHCRSTPIEETRGGVVENGCSTRTRTVEAGSHRPEDRRVKRVQCLLDHRSRNRQMSTDWARDVLDLSDATRLHVRHAYPSALHTRQK